MLRVAMLSKWHVHAEGYAKEFLKTGKAVVRRRAKAYALFRNVPDFAARCRKKLRRARLLNKKGM